MLLLYFFLFNLSVTWLTIELIFLCTTVTLHLFSQLTLSMDDFYDSLPFAADLIALLFVTFSLFRLLL